MKRRAPLKGKSKASPLLEATRQVAEALGEHPAFRTLQVDVMDDSAVNKLDPCYPPGTVLVYGPGKRVLTVSVEVGKLE